MIAPAASRTCSRRGALLILPAVCMAGLVGVALVAIAYSYRLTNPPEYAPLTPAAGTTTDAVGAYRARNPRTEHGLEFSDVEFPAASGATLRGWLVPAAAGTGGAAGRALGIVAAHARAGDRRDYLDQLPLFHRLGASVVHFDYREHGVSDGAGRGMSLGYREAQDVSSATRYLREVVGVRRVVAIGHSLGGSAAILAAGADASIDGVLAESSIASFEEYVDDLSTEWLERRGLERLAGWRPQLWPRAVVGLTTWRLGIVDLRAPVDVVGALGPRPLLLVHGSSDTIVDPSHSARLFARAREPRTLWLPEGAGHNGAFGSQPDEYAARLAALLEQVLSR